MTHSGYLKSPGRVNFLTKMSCNKYKGFNYTQYTVIVNISLNL